MQYQQNIECTVTDLKHEKLISNLYISVNIKDSGQHYIFDQNISRTKQVIATVNEIYIPFLLIFSMMMNLEKDKGIFVAHIL